MTRDASLDEFLGGGDEESGGEATEDEGAATEPADPVDGAEEPADATETVDESPADADGDEAPPLAPAAVDPAHSTYDWSPDGAECADCGATVEARWRDESGLVCPDCKEW